MKKFIFIVLMSLIGFAANAQFIEKHDATQSEWNEWKTIQQQIATGNKLVTGGIMVGTLSFGVTTYLVIKNNNRGEDAYVKYADDGSVRMTIPYSEINATIKTVGYGIAAIGAGCAVYGIYLRMNGRKKLDRFYFNGNGVTFTF